MRQSADTMEMSQKKDQTRPMFSKIVFYYSQIMLMFSIPTVNATGNITMASMAMQHLNMFCHQMEAKTSIPELKYSNTVNNC